MMPLTPGQFWAVLGLVFVVVCLAGVSNKKSRRRNRRPRKDRYRETPGDWWPDDYRWHQ